MSEKAPFIDEDEGLMNGSNTQKSKDYEDDKFCVRNWKVIFAGTGVILLISLGVIIGSVFNHNDNSDSVGRGARSTYFPYKNIRLPGDITPLRYQLFLHPNITNKADLSFTGTVSILVKVNKDSVSSVLLHSKDLTIKKINLYEIPKDWESKSKGKDPLFDIEDIKDVADIKYKDYLTDNKKNEMIMIRLKDTDTLDNTLLYVLKIKFGAKLSTGLEGFYLSSYKKKGKKEST